MATKIIKRFTEKDAIKQALEIIDSYPESERPRLLINYTPPNDSSWGGTFKMISCGLLEGIFESVLPGSMLHGIRHTMKLDGIYCLEVLVEE